MMLQASWQMNIHTEINNTNNMNSMNNNHHAKNTKNEKNTKSGKNNHKYEYECGLSQQMMLDIGTNHYSNNVEKCVYRARFILKNINSNDGNCVMVYKYIDSDDRKATNNYKTTTKLVAFTLC